MLSDAEKYILKQNTTRLFSNNSWLGMHPLEYIYAFFKIGQFTASFSLFSSFEYNRQN